jgi:hypothetical protein
VKQYVNDAARILALAVPLTAAAAAGWAVAAAAELDSVAAAAQLTSILDSRKADAFAAEHPEMPGRFVAALYYPGAQILAISAVAPVPELVRQRIGEGDHRQVYIDLSTSAEQPGRLFVEDLGPPGLRQMRDDNQRFDITWRDGTRRTTYDGNWKAQQLSDAEYRTRFAVDDAEYADMLQVLVAAVQMPAKDTVSR